MTPEQKWRAEAIAWLQKHSAKGDYSKYSNGGLHILIRNAFNEIRPEYDYLMVEYINIKPHSNDTTNKTNG